MNPHKHTLEPLKDNPGHFYCTYAGGCWIEFWSDEAVEDKLEEMRGRDYREKITE